MTDLAEYAGREKPERILVNFLYSLNTKYSLFVKKVRKCNLPASLF